MMAYIDIVDACKTKIKPEELNPHPSVDVRANDDMLLKIICTEKNFHLLDWLLTQAEQHGKPYGVEIYSILEETNLTKDEESVDTFIKCVIDYSTKSKQTLVTNEIATPNISEQIPVIDELVTPNIILEQTPVKNGSSVIIDGNYVKQWADQHADGRMNEHFVRIIIEHNRLDILIWLTQPNNYTWENGDIKLRHSTTINNIYTSAIRCNNLTIMKWAHSIKNYKITSEICDIAVANSKLEIIEWLKNVAPKNYNFCTSAAKYGKLNILKWAYENGFVLNKMVCNYAAKNGNLEILNWAHEHNCEWDFWVCYFAAESGNLEILKWARENGCFWNNSICTVAARKGHFDILKWAINNGCPYNKNDCLNAAESGKNDLYFNYIRTNQKKTGKDYDEIIQFVNVYEHNPITIMERNADLIKDLKSKDNEIVKLCTNLKHKDNQIEDYQRDLKLQSDLIWRLTPKSEKCDKLEMDLKLKDEQIIKLNEDFKDLEILSKLNNYKLGELKQIAQIKHEQIVDLEKDLKLKEDQIMLLTKSLEHHDDKIINEQNSVEKSKIFDTNEYAAFKIINATNSRKQGIQKLIKDITIMVNNRHIEGAFDYELDKNQIKFYDEIRLAFEHYGYIVGLITNVNNKSSIHIEW